VKIHDGRQALQGGILFGVVIASLRGLSPAPAMAEWQYTTWGMKPEEAVKAANGAMKLLSSKGRTKADLTHTEKAAEGEFRDGALRLHVEFLIDTKTGGLVCVTYTPLDATQNEPLKQTLVKRYGPPLGGFPSGAAPVDLMGWDQADTIDYQGVRGTPASVIHCKKGGPLG
jgi:hypothetical protein